MPDIRRELGVLMRPTVLMSLATTVMGAGAMFTLYTYVAPVLADRTGASEGFVTLALVLIGVGFTIGNALGGRLADWSLNGATRIFLAALAIISLILPLMLGSHIGAAIGLLAWGAAAFAIVPPVQTRVMQAAAEAPGLASSINIGAFNLGNAVGLPLAAASSARATAMPPFRLPVAFWRQRACCSRCPAARKRHWPRRLANPASAGSAAAPAMRTERQRI